MNGIFYDRPVRYKYSIAFESKVNPLVSVDTDKYLSLAAQENFKKYLPKNIDFTKKIDFLGVCGEAFLANKLNLNLDGVGTDEAIKIAELFPMSFIDADHNRKSIIGTVLSSSFAEYGTGKELTKEEASKLKSPFSVILSGIIWRVANPDLANAIEASSDSSSEFYNKLFYSWELCFSSFHLILMDSKKSNFEDGKIISDAEEIRKLENRLKCYGGSGLTDDGLRIGRIPVGEDLLPLGIGVVENPAGQLQPITSNADKSSQSSANQRDTKENNTNMNIDKEQITKIIEDVLAKKSSKQMEKMMCPECDAEMDMENEMNDDMEMECAKCGKKSKAKSWKQSKSSQNDEKNENNISQAQKVVVNDVDKQICMKITSIKDLTDEKLKECKASEIQASFNEILKVELDKISEDYEKKKTQADKDIKAAQESAKEANDNYTKTQEQLKKVTEDLNKLVETNKQKEKVETFSARMETLENTFDLSEEEKNLLAEDVKVCENDETFAKFLKKQDILLAAKKKSGKVFDPKTKKWMTQEEMDKMHKDMKTAKASTEEDKTVVDDALKNAEKDKKVVANATEGNKPSLLERAKASFGKDGWERPQKRA